MKQILKLSDTEVTMQTGRCPELFSLSRTTAFECKDTWQDQLGSESRLTALLTLPVEVLFVMWAPAQKRAEQRQLPVHKLSIL